MGTILLFGDESRQLGAGVGARAGYEVLNMIGNGSLIAASGTSLTYTAPSQQLIITGNFSDFRNGAPTSGVVTSLTYRSLFFQVESRRIEFTGLSLDVATLLNWGAAAKGIGFAMSPFENDLNTLLINGANVVGGTPYQDQISGVGGDDLIYGYGGNDTLSGEIGADTLFGGFGVDTLYAGSGDDVLGGEADFDLMFGETGNDAINGGDGADVGLGGEGADTLNGGDGVDTLLGEAGEDTLNGDAGGDVLWGGDGADTLNGGEGIDFLYGQAGNDVLTGGGDVNVYIGGDGDDVMAAGASTTNATQVFYGETGANLASGGVIGNDSATGGAGTDWFILEAGDDTMFGAAGNDMFYGGDGNDLIDMRDGAGASPSGDYAWGHSGADTFLTQAGQAGVEVIMDFQAGAGAGDVLRLLGTNYASFEQLLSASIESGGFTIIPISGGAEAVYLFNVAKAQLANDDFLFT